MVGRDFFKTFRIQKWSSMGSALFSEITMLCWNGCLNSRTCSRQFYRHLGSNWTRNKITCPGRVYILMSQVCFRLLEEIFGWNFKTRLFSRFREYILREFTEFEGQGAVYQLPMIRREELPLFLIFILCYCRETFSIR